MSNNPGHKPKPLAKCPPLLPISKKMAALSPLLDAERVGTQLAANGSKSPTLEQLFETLPIVSHLHSDYGGSAKALWLFSSAWSRYFRNASFSESEDALPALNRFVDSLFQFASRANAGLSIVALECAELLLRHNIPVISSSFAKVLAFEGRDEVRQTALEIMERNLAFMLQPSCIEAIGELLKEYEDGPASFNPTIARSASAFLFAWKDQLFEDGRTHMIAYPIAWADQLPLEGRILLMIDARRQLKKGEAADILVRTAEMAANPLIQHAAVDSLLNMGISRYFYKNSMGEEIEARRVNRMLEERLIEQTVESLDEEFLRGKTLVVGNAICCFCGQKRLH